MKYEFEAIGTHWSIEVYENLSPSHVDILVTAINERIAVFDKDYSRFREDSWVMRLAQSAGVYELPQDAPVLFQIYKDMYELTQGQFTPLVGQLLVDAGYDAQYSFIQKKILVKPFSFHEAVEYNPPFVKIASPVLLDFGAAGKGYLVDIVSEIIESNGFFSYCVDAGGDMQHRSRAGTHLQIGLENPFDISQVIGILSLENKSLAGSAGNRRAWKGFHHIIDPNTQISPEHISAVWVVAESTLLADALTTALYFTSPSALLEKYQFEYLIVYKDMSVQGSLLGNPMLHLF